MRTIRVKGRLVAPTTVDLAHPLPTEVRDVGVVAQVAAAGSQRVTEILKAFPRGTRSKGTIDREIEEERDSWD